jgi:rhamnulokinase
MRTEFGIAHDLVLSTVGSHDTASAVVGVPMRTENAAYISCGTWSLVGTELPSPVVTDAAREAGFTNEGGVDGRIRFLKNVMGLWLLSESIRAWAKVGERADLEHLLAQAAQAPVDVPVFDANDPRLLAPGDMPARIEVLYAEQGVRAPASIPEFVRSVLQSLANAYADAIRDVERLTGGRIDSVHLVGGGAQNELLCRLTADAVGVPVVAGPVEATAIGNLLVQARTHRLLSGDLEALRAVVRSSFPLRTYAPGDS